MGKEKTERLRQAEKAYGIDEEMKLETDALYILVDDVTTTGASLMAAKKILQAKQVWAAVLMKERWLVGGTDTDHGVEHEINDSVSQKWDDETDDGVKYSVFGICNLFRVTTGENIAETTIN